MSNLFMLVGLPGSGKSTFFSNFESSNRKGTAILSTDSYIEQIAKFENKTYDEVFGANIKDAEESLLMHLSSAISWDQDIIWDQTNLSVKSRKTKLAKIPSHYKKIALVFTCSEEEHARRLASRPGKTIPSHILENMKKSFVMPSIEEGFDFVYTIST